MSGPSQATALRALQVRDPATRIFHLSWMVQFACGLAWFAYAPLKPRFAEHLALMPAQLTRIDHVAVAAAIAAAFAAGPICARLGPGRTLAALLLLSCLGLLGMAAAADATALMTARIMLGFAAAGWVVSLGYVAAAYAPNVLGLALATVTGLGSLGVATAWLLLPALAATDLLGGRSALLVPAALTALLGLVCAVAAPACPGTTARRTPRACRSGAARRNLLRAALNYRSWMLAIACAASFGIEVYVHALTARTWSGQFGVSFGSVGIAASGFAAAIVLARVLGGTASDRLARVSGLDGRGLLLFALLFGEGIDLLLLSQAQGTALSALLVIGAIVLATAAAAAAFALAPFVDRRALGSVLSITVAGGLLGAVAATLLATTAGDPHGGLLLVGSSVTIASLSAVALRFGARQLAREHIQIHQALRQRGAVTV
ncbi:MAG: MFS transporter [Nevskiales bacterium]|nr:MFS transporter [Nevskiales bacterium]